jgi:hypothetical protein
MLFLRAQTSFLLFLSLFSRSVIQTIPLLEYMNHRISSLFMQYKINTDALFQNQKKRNGKESISTYERIIYHNTQIMDEIYHLFISTEHDVAIEIAIINDIRNELEKITKELKVYNI